MHFFLISHVVFQNGVPIYGPVQVLQKYLEQRKHKVYLALLPLDQAGSYSTTGKKNGTHEKHFSHLVVKYLYDIWYCFRYLLLNKPQKNDVVIAVDPLNCISAVILAPFLKFKLVYYTADYSDVRFSNALLNEVYFLLDQICLYFCDQNWCVSERIVQKRKEQGKKEGVYFIPNTPIFKNMKPSSQREKMKDKLLYVGRMDEKMNAHLFVPLVKLLRKKYKDISLTLIGGGVLDKTIQQEIALNKVEKHIRYLGPQPNQVVVDEIRKHGVGLALYSGGHMWNTYGDSMKIREYQYFGLPVISTEVPANAPEIEKYQAGKVLSSKELTIDHVIDAYEHIYIEYKMYSNNALRLSEERKKEHFLDTALSAL